MQSDYAYRTYAQRLRWHGIGHALYSPVTSDRIRVGAVGFFDLNGVWNLLQVDSFVSELGLRIATAGPWDRSPMISQGTKGVGIALGMNFE